MASRKKHAERSKRSYKTKRQNRANGFLLLGRKKDKNSQ